MIEQWLGALEVNDISTRVFIILAVTIVASLVVRLVVSALRKKAEKTETHWDDSFAQSLGGPSRLLVLSLIHI